MTTHGRLVAAVKREGFANAEDIVLASHGRVPLSAAMAMILSESKGRNVFGHDRTGSIPSSWKGGRVTRLRYLYYKARRRSYGAQGVGPGQLTSPGLQDQADGRGGCWKPLHNLEVAFAFLAGLKAEFGSWRLAYQHYNGSGPAAVQYGERTDAQRQRYHDILEEALR